MALVTRKSWDESFAQARARIEEAAFVAIDLELSGVQTTQWRAATELDSLDTRYFNLRDSADKFAILQVGLCPFSWDAAHNKFTAHPFNFCIFPRDELAVELPARDFLCQSTSLEFLAKHKFDFNACIYDGISYLSHEREALARSRLGEPDKPVAQIPLTRTGDVLFSESVRVQAGEWRDRMLNRDENEAGTCLVVEVSGTYQANLVHQVLRKSFQDLVAFTEEDAKKVRVALPRSTDEKDSLLRQWEGDKRKRMEVQVMEAVGFRHLIDALVRSKKPLVGHNCFLDFAHIYGKFFRSLPLSCTEFCSAVHELFPWIFDTKYLLKTDTSIQEMLGERSTTLGAVYNNVSKLQKKAVVELGSAGQRYEGSEMKHEAGYDAYMTGVIFANMCRLLNFAPSLLSVFTEGRQPSGQLPIYANLLYLGWLSQFVLDLTTGREAVGNRCLKMHRQNKVANNNNHRNERVALVWGWDCSISVQDVEKQLTGCFGSSRPEMEVVSIDQGSAFVMFKKKESLDQLVHAFQNSTASVSCDARALVAKGVNLSRFHLFEELCRSPLSTPRFMDAAKLMLLSSQTENDTEAPQKKRPRLSAS